MAVPKKASFGPHKVRRVATKALIYVFLATIVVITIITVSMPHVLYHFESTKTYSQPKRSWEDVEILRDLGFIEKPLLYPQRHQKIDPQPVFAISLQSGYVAAFDEFIVSFRKYFLKHVLVVYDLNMSKEENEIVEDRCFCQVRKVKLSRFPDHVRTFSNYAYIPILIQESLLDFGNVFWCDVHMTFTSFSLIKESEFVATRFGLAVWPKGGFPTSAFTHSNMFQFFNQSVSSFHFHKFALPVPGHYINVDILHTSVMLPWVQCALKRSCVYTRGVPIQGCDMNLKPRYVFAGCHHNTISAFNVILGHAHHFRNPYIVEESLFTLQEGASGMSWNVLHKLTTRFKKNLQHLKKRIFS